jgi:hypothetical protein
MNIINDLDVMHDFIHVLSIVVNVNVVIQVIYDQRRNSNKYLFFVLLMLKKEQAKKQK